MTPQRMREVAEYGRGSSMPAEVRDAMRDAADRIEKLAEDVTRLADALVRAGIENESLRAQIVTLSKPLAPVVTVESSTKGKRS